MPRRSLSAYYLRLRVLGPRQHAALSARPIAAPWRRLRLRLLARAYRFLIPPSLIPPSLSHPAHSPLAAPMQVPRPPLSHSYIHPYCIIPLHFPLTLYLFLWQLNVARP
ncbi:hypothetical protein C8R45DRAFT_1114727 [Mycena sanguinolenta]|nr:hypothetical protein C8R45DRAFT_1114727 [Mycena sanguinolenta]